MSLLGQGEEPPSPTAPPFLPPICVGNVPEWVQPGLRVALMYLAAPGAPRRLFRGVMEPKPAHRHPQNPNLASWGSQW